MSSSKKQEVDKITQLILRLSKRPRDYVEDATLRSDICIDRMVEYLDRRWGKHWWYRYFVKNRIGELRRVMLDLAAISSNYQGHVSKEEIALLTSAVSDVERIDKLNDLFQTHRVMTLSTGEHIMTDRVTNRTCSRALHLRQLSDNYIPPPAEEEEMPRVLELDPNH